MKETQTKESIISAGLAELQSIPRTEDIEHLSGKLPFQMTNDALFHIVFEANPVLLRDFICSLLQLQIEDILSIELTNPIEFGNSIYSKSFLLDLKIRLNTNIVINIEMQVVNLSFWKERSLGYLCRAFDNLNKGDSYTDTKPAIHIGILDFEIFPNDTEFYSTYHLANDCNHKIYSDKFRLSVLQLRQEEHATEIDKQWNLHLWARLFKATTWEEIKMLAEKNPTFKGAIETIYRVSSDDRVRELCQAREDGERTQRTIELLHQRELQEAREEGERTRKTIELLHQRELQEARELAQEKEEEIMRLKEELAALKNSKE